MQLSMFRLNYSFSNSAEAAELIRGLPVEVRRLFGQVENLVRLLLVVPVSERRFSVLRRLKTWLRSTMTQNRLNLVAICHVHQEKLDLLDKKSICKPFVAANDRRIKHFWLFCLKQCFSTFCVNYCHSKCVFLYLYKCIFLVE